eukprot:gene24624-biopygen5948
MGETAADADRTRTGRGPYDRIQRNERGPYDRIQRNERGPYDRIQRNERGPDAGNAVSPSALPPSSAAHCLSLTPACPPPARIPQQPVGGRATGHSREAPVWCDGKGTHHTQSFVKDIRTPCALRARKKTDGTRELSNDGLGGPSSAFSVSSRRSQNSCGGASRPTAIERDDTVSYEQSLPKAPAVHARKEHTTEGAEETKGWRQGCCWEDLQKKYRAASHTGDWLDSYTESDPVRT